MKYMIFTAAALLLSTIMIQAQNLVSKVGYVKFYSHTPVEDIEAHNRQVVSILNTETGALQFKLLVKSFEFEKKLMQEHFNENYMHSDEYPNSTFKGKVMNINEIDFLTDTKHEVTVEGELTIKGVTKKVSEKGTLEMKDGKIMTVAVFPVKLSEYDVKIPKAVIDNISESVEVTVDVALEKYQK